LQDHLIVRDKVNHIEDYLQAADLGLFTSELETFGLSILEAMTFACPSLAWRVGGIPEVIEHGVSGILLPFGDIPALAAAVEDLIANPTRRHEMGLAAQRRARDLFSADRIVPQYQSLYHRVCGG
jgi:glycosyltransferase involved in cell wall biosynthesis